MRRTPSLLACVTLLAASLCEGSSARAHVGVISGPVFAGSNAVVTLSVGHGCQGADTVQIEATLPVEVVTVRGAPSFMGDPELIADDTGIVRTLAWKKANARAQDDFYYQVTFRIAVPDMPFTRLYFPIRQTCRTSGGEERVTEWAAIPTPGEMTSENAPPPAAELVILPARKPGWNKYKVAKSISDLSIFDDAQIVWAGDAAYSSNEATAALIEAEDGVEKLTEIKASTDIWVKY